MSRRGAFLTIALGSAMFTLTTLANVDTCPSSHADADRIFWDSYAHSSIYKDWLVSFYALERSHWDAGWGWTAESATAAFPKMWNALDVLGLIDEKPAGRWSLERVVAADAAAMPDLAGAATGQPQVVAADDGRTHVYLRAASGELIHYVYDPTAADPSTDLTYENISTTSTGGPAANLRFSGELAIAPPLSGQLARVLGLPGRSVGNLIHFRQTAGGATGSWTGSVVRGPGTETFQVKSAVATLVADVFHAVGIDRRGGPIYYRIDSSGSAAIERMVVAAAPYAIRASSAPGSVAIHVSANGRVDVLAVSEIGRRSLYHWARESGSAWHFDNLTTTTGSTDPVSESSRVALRSDGAGRLVAYVRDTQGEVVRYTGEMRCSAASCAPKWAASNLTATATRVSQPPAGETWSVDGRMHDGPYAAFHDGREIVVGRGPGPRRGSPMDDVKCYVQSASGGWEVADLTLNAAAKQSALVARAALHSSPVVVTSGEGLHVLGTNASGELVEYHCAAAGLAACELSWPTSSASSELAAADRIVAGRAGPLAGVAAASGLNVVAIHGGGRALMHFERHVDRPWHRRGEYQLLASGHLHGFRYEPRNQPIGIAGYMPFTFPHRVEMFCRAFDGDSDPGFRAGAILHEAMHRFNQGGAHDANEQDVFYPHDKDSRPLTKHKHSSHQITLEFLSDLSQFPTDDVPLIVRLAAESTARHLLRELFSDDPGWNLGHPVP